MKYNLGTFTTKKGKKEKKKKRKKKRFLLIENRTRVNCLNSSVAHH